MCFILLYNFCLQYFLFQKLPSDLCSRRQQKRREVFMKNVGYCCLAVTKLRKGSQSVVKTFKYNIVLISSRDFRVVREPVDGEI